MMRRFKYVVLGVLGLGFFGAGLFSVSPVLSPRAVWAASYTVGQPVWVEWHGSWYKAKVIGFGSGCTQIHYEGYSNSWDECVAPRRIKPR